MKCAISWVLNLSLVKLETNRNNVNSQPFVSLNLSRLVWDMCIPDFEKKKTIVLLHYVNNQICILEQVSEGGEANDENKD